MLVASPRPRFTTSNFDLRIKAIMSVIVRSSKALLTFACIAALSVGLLIGSLFLSHSTTPTPPWNPLGEYPVQRVDSREVPFIKGPSVYAPGVVLVTATKCTNEPVVVQGSSHWQRVEPLGRIIQTGSGIGDRPLGCTTVDYKNDIPEEVVLATMAVGGSAVWRIVGTETPVRPSGEKGVDRQWQTQNFTIVVGGGQGDK